MRSSPAIGVDGSVYVSAGNGSMFALHGSSGAIMWSNSDAPYGSPSVSTGGLVFCGTTLDSGNNLTAMDAGTGAVIWSVQVTTRT